ncbi:MAG: hypothetical protein U0271_23225 [Polyangiaceae bacterium]
MPRSDVCSLSLVLAAQLFGCATNSSEQGAKRGDTGAQTSSTPAASSSPAPSVSASATSAPKDRCADLSDRFRAVMKQATGVCKTDADCGCFQPVVEEAGCGGITDKATTDRLDALTSQFLSSANGQRACSWPHQCGPWACEPVCQRGRCVNSAVGGMVLPP